MSTDFSEDSSDSPEENTAGNSVASLIGGSTASFLNYMSYESSQINPSIITKKRPVMFFSDVEKFLSEKFKDKLKLVEEIIETNQENIEKVFSDIVENIEKGGEPINRIYRVIEHALNIRFYQTESLLSLFSLLSKKYGYENNENNYECRKSIRLYSMLVQQGIIPKKEEKEVLSMKEIIEVFPEDSIEKSFINDDVDTFIKKSPDDSFNANVSIDSKSPVHYVTEWATSEVSYLHLMAYFGAVKCFKYTILTEDFNLEYLEEYAVAGGNMEIIKLLEQKGSSFVNCLTISIKFHRHEVSDWILLHYECKESSFYNSIIDCNYRAFFFATLNGIVLDNYMIDSTSGGDIDIVKYLTEECHADTEVKDWNKKTPLHIASEKGYSDIVKYLNEERHASSSNTSSE